jgi:hypothetical protein
LSFTVEEWPQLVLEGIGANVERTNALWPIELVGRHGSYVNTESGNGHIRLAESLRGVNVQRDPA